MQCIILLFLFFYCSFIRLSVQTAPDLGWFELALAPRRERGMGKFLQHQNITESFTGLLHAVRIAIFSSWLRTTLPWTSSSTTWVEWTPARPSTLLMWSKRQWNLSFSLVVASQKTKSILRLVDFFYLSVCPGQACARTAIKFWMV